MLACLTAIAVFPAAARAQTDTLGLQGIIAGKSIHGQKIKSVDKVWADSLGGEILCTVEHANNGVVEQIKVTWQFDSDVTTLPAGSNTKVNMQTKILRAGKPHPKRPTNWIGTSGGGALKSAHLQANFPNALSKWAGYIYGGKNEDRRVLGRRDQHTRPNIDRVGSTSYLLHVKEGVSDDSFCAMHFQLQDYFEVLYVYRANVPAKSAKLGDPPKRARTESTISGTNSGTRGTNGGSSGTGAGGSANTNNREVIVEEGTRHGTPPRRVASRDTGVPLPDRGNAGRTSASGTILEANRVRVRPNETVRLQINLRNAQNIANMNFDALFEESVARPVGKAIQGGLISGMRFENNTAQQGKIRVGFAAETGTTGTGSVAYVEFRAYGRPGDRTPVTLNVTTANHPDGRVPSIEEVAGEILIVGDDGFQPGDTDGNGIIDERDAGDALKMSVDLIPTDMRADFDQDGRVTSRDAALIMQQARR